MHKLFIKQVSLDTKLVTGLLQLKLPPPYLFHLYFHIPDIILGHQMVYHHYFPSKIRIFQLKGGDDQVTGHAVYFL